MACEDMTSLLHASLDDELDAEHATRVERHLADCAACAAELHRLRVLKAAIRDHATYHRLPAAHRSAVLARLRAAAGAPPTARRGGLTRHVVSRRAIGGMAASLLIGLTVGSWLGPLVLGSGGEPDLSDTLVAAHVRALQPGHAIDVVSSDQHTVKPWFDGRADFSPPVKDLGEQGFALIGGRLDYVDHRTVAVIVYRRRQHQIDLFAWPLVAAAEQRSPVGIADGYHLRSWTQDGFRLVAVSNLNESELDEFVQRWRAS
jgi:anti-sigma factor RsiW